MTQSLKIECLVTDLALEGEIASFLVTKEQLTAGLSKKADLVEGKIQESNLPDFIANSFQTINQKLVTLEESISDGIQSAKDYSEAYTDEKLIVKADLVDGKVPQTQLPSVEQYEGLSEVLNGVLVQARRDMIERTDEIQRVKADLGEDGKVVREQLPNYDKIPGLESVIVDLNDSKADVSDVYKKSETMNVEEIEATVERISPTRDEVEKSLMLSEVVQVHGFEQEYVLAGGYPFGAVLTLDDGITEVVSAINNNKNNPNENVIGWKPHGVGKFITGMSYGLNAEVILTNGNKVKSTIADNTVNPNVDMTGWKKPQASSIFDSSGLSQQIINDSVNKDSSLSIVSGFSNNNADQVLSFLQFNKMMAKFQPSAEISIEKPIVVDLTGTKSSEIDLQGATLNFKTGGRLTFRGKSTPYLTTIATTDLRRGGTYFQVASVAGIAKGDLIVVKSPVVITSAAKLTQTYIVHGIDVANRYIYVMACIVGDMRADQITAQGLTGNITVECYKVADRIKVTNGKIASLNRDDESTAVYFDGFYHIDCMGLTPDKTNRTSISAAFFGFWDIDKCLVIDPGYVENDQGYNSIPSNPSGLGFGYGFLANNGFCARFFNNHVVAGWHGFDAAVGVTFAIAMNNTIYKGAFGISTHEGQWSLLVQGNQILGGHAVTCRSFELTFKDNIGRGIKNRFVIGSRRMQSLIFDNNDIELSNSYDGNFIYLDGAYPESCFSLDEPVAKVSRNTVRGLKGVSSRLYVWKNLDMTDNDFGFGNLGNISLGALVPTGVLNMKKNTWTGNIQQAPITINEAFGEVNIIDEDDYTTPTLGGSSFIQFSVPLPKVNLIDIKCRNKNSTVRNINNSVINFENVIGNKDFNNVVIDNSPNNTVQRYFRNLTKNPIPANNVVNYVNQKDNLLLDKVYQASKTHDWASVANNAQQSTTVSLSGAVIGDKVQATMNVPLQGTRIWAEVTATNTVTVYQSNNTGATVDVPSGTLIVNLI